MDSLIALQIGGKISWGLFIFAVGACVGSLTNVLVYRLPLGLDVILSPSRCPACGTRLTWRENFPVLGWLLLGGKCRFCRSKISPEYPLVETFTGLLFLAVFALWYLLPNHAVWLGIDWGQARPDWAMNDAFDGFPRLTWGPLIAVLALMGSLTAMTLVDAKTFMIPLPIPWFATVVGILFHTIGAAVVGPLHSHAPDTNWAIPQCGGNTPQTSDGWWWIGATLGAMLGLGLGMILLRFRLIRRSFEDYQEWEDRAKAEIAAKNPQLEPESSSGKPAHESDSGISALPELNVAGPVGEEAGQGAWLALRFIVFTALGIAIMTAAGNLWSAQSTGRVPPWIGLAIGVLASPILAGFAVQPQASRLFGHGTSKTHQPIASISEPQMWIRYPHARREMVKELIFLTPCIGLAWLGGWAASHLGSHPAKIPPFWLVVLCGTLLGYLVGGGVVWGVRILGSLAFGKEAMGLGDVHLLAAVGACVGWIDAALALPIAAVVALYCMAVGGIITRAVGRALPFGPYLAGATVIVVVGKPLIEAGLTWLWGQPVNLP